MQNNRNGFFTFFRDNNLKLYNSQIKTSPYLDLEKYFPEHKILEENWIEIKNELQNVIDSGKTLPKFHDIDDGQEYISDNDGLSWNLLNLLVYGMWHKENITLFPITTSILRKIKSVKSANFSILAPGKHIPPHKGPYKGVMRYQLALNVPKKGECKIFVDGTPHYWKEGKSVLFDDTYTHEVVNKTEESRVALLLDIKRNTPGFFMCQYDALVFRLIQLLVVFNNTFSKSAIK